MDVFASFLQGLYSMSRGSEDELWWVPSKTRFFNVKSFYCSLGCREGNRFPWKSVWRSKAPLRMTFFACSVSLGKVLTTDNIKKRHVIVVGRCCICKRNGEFVMWLMPRSVGGLFACWWTSGSFGVQLCGRWCPCAFCGAYGRK